MRAFGVQWSVAVGLAAVACGGQDPIDLPDTGLHTGATTETGGPTTTVDPNAYLRVVNLALHASEIDVYLDDETKKANEGAITFGSASDANGSWFTIPAGIHGIHVTLKGDDPGKDLVFEPGADLTNGNHFTLLVVGDADGTGDALVKPWLVQDVLDTEAGSANARVYNTVAGSRPITVLLQDSTVVASKVPYMSVSPLVSLLPGAAQWRVDVTGDGGPDRQNNVNLGDASTQNAYFLPAGTGIGSLVFHRPGEPIEVIGG